MITFDDAAARRDQTHCLATSEEFLGILASQPSWPLGWRLLMVLKAKPKHQ